jgi:hypothetical protein
MDDNMMLNWLKFFPFSIEKDSRNKPAEIHGPYFSKLRKNKWTFGDTNLLFDAPWANPIFSLDGSGSTVDAIKPGRVNILKDDWERVYNNSDAPRDFLDKSLFYENTWYFSGPWFSGMKEFLIGRAILASVSKGSRFEKLNLLDPRIFEIALSDFLDHAYGYDRSGKRPHYRGPLNWSVLPMSPTVHGIVCDIHQIHNGSRDNPVVTRLVFFPVTSSQFIRVSFSFGGLDIHDEVRAKPIFALCDSIIDSMRLEVGLSTQAEWNKVKESCPDMSLSETMGEFKWPLFKEEPNKEPTEKEILQDHDVNRIPDRS